MGTERPDPVSMLKGCDRDTVGMKVGPRSSIVRSGYGVTRRMKTLDVSLPWGIDHSGRSPCRRRPAPRSRR